MDALNWGFLTLVGVGLFTLCFYLIYDILTAPSFDKGKVLALGLSSLALVGANRSAAIVFIVTALAFGVVALIVGGRLRKGVLRLVPAALLALVLSLFFISTYLRVTFAVGDKRFLTIASSWQDLSAGWDTLRYFFATVPPLVWAVVAIGGLAGAVALFRRTSEGGALLLTLFVAPLVLSMMVVGEIAERSAYFLYVPIWLGVAVWADVLVGAVRERRRVVAGGSVWALALLALVAALTIWRGHVSLRDAAEWYGYLGTEHVKAIEAADRLAPAGAGVVSPRGLSGWVHGLAARRPYAGEQRDVGGALLAGDRVTTNGVAFVADAYSVPEVPMDPVVGSDKGAFKHLLYLDDRLIYIEYGDGPASRWVALADAELQQHVTATESGTWVDRRTYHLDGLQVVKEVTLPEHGDQVTVTLRVDSARGPVTRVVVPLQPALASVPASLGAQEAIFGFKGRDPFDSDWWTGAYVDLIGGASDAATLMLIAGEGEGGSLWRPAGETIAVADVRSHSPQAEVTLVFTFKGSPSPDQDGLITFTAWNAIRYHDITFAVVDRQPSEPWFGDPVGTTTLAWLENGPYFQPLWDGGNVAAYRVVPPAEQPDGGKQTRSATHSGG